MLREQKPEILSEESAAIVTVTGWACKHCKRWWGDDERMARYCCATSFPCDCGKRRPKHYTVCDACRSRLDAERWFAKPAIEWDGNFPIGLWDDDKYFFDEDDLCSCLDENQLQGNAIDDLWFTSCEPNNGRHFEMSEFLCDDLGEDQELDDKEINKVVNNWIASNSPFSWSMTGKRLSGESITRHLAEE